MLAAAILALAACGGSAGQWASINTAQGGAISGVTVAGNYLFTMTDASQAVVTADGWLSEDQPPTVMQASPVTVAHFCEGTNFSITYPTPYVPPPTPIYSGKQLDGALQLPLFVQNECIVWYGPFKILANAIAADGSTMSGSWSFTPAPEIGTMLQLATGFTKTQGTFTAVRVPPPAPGTYTGELTDQSGATVQVSLYIASVESSPGDQVPGGMTGELTVSGAISCPEVNGSYPFVPPAEVAVGGDGSIGGANAGLWLGDLIYLSLNPPVSYQAGNLTGGLLNAGSTTLRIGQIPASTLAEMRPGQDGPPGTLALSYLPHTSGGSSVPGCLEALSGVLSR